MSLLKRKNRGGHVSHKVIEKRRRDRINNCLAELSQSVPAAFTKQTAGKLEKAEILEMTVDYLRAINSLNLGLNSNGVGDWLQQPDVMGELQRHFIIGYGECLREVLRYVTEVEGFQLGDVRCSRMITHLQGKGSDLIETMAGSDGQGQKALPLPQSHHRRHHHHPYQDVASSSSVNSYLQWNSLTRLRAAGGCLCCCQSSSSAFVATAANSKPFGCFGCSTSTVPTPDKLPTESISHENMYNSYYHFCNT